MEFTSRNSLKSIVSIVGRSESAKDRRSAINGSWSDQELAERRRLAVQMQVGLAALIPIDQQKNPRLKRTFELAS